MRQLPSVLVLCFLIISCTQPDPLSFVNKYDGANFSTFRNTGIFIRGNDERGNVLLFVSQNLTDTFHNGPIILAVDRDTKIIKEFNYKPSKDSNKVDKERLQQLAIQFLKYKIYSLSVDTSDNVFIRLQPSDRPQLARFSERKFITSADVFKSKWQHLKGNWYVVASK